MNRSLRVNGRPQAPTSVEAFEILSDVASALERLRAAGFVNVVVTNQPDLATGRLSPATLQAMHEALGRLAIDAIRVCGHTDADACACRKPLPGMLLDAARDMAIDLGASALVGDRWRDIAAGQAAGCRCFFVDHDYAERRPTPPYTTVRTLSDAVDLILTDGTLGRTA